MMTLSVPEDGLVLLRTPERGPASNNNLPPQVMRLNLAQKLTEDLLKSFQNKEKISIRFGKRLTLQHGKKTFPVFSYPESYPSELYQRSTDDDDTFYFSGKLTHKLESQKAQTDTSKTDEALANLENSLKSFEEQKASNEARFVTDKDELRHLTEASQKGRGHQPPASIIRKDRFLNTFNRSTPSSPFLGAALSPAFGPTSIARSVPASLSKDQIRLDAIKTPFLHLLAVKPLTPKDLAETLLATKDDCEKLLYKYGKDVREANGKQELKDKAYRDLDLWKFPYPGDSDRRAAIERSISAFDRMRISTTDAIWETLLSVKERGKGKGSELSRLKIGQLALNGGTPKPSLSQGGARSVTDTETDHGKPAGKAKGSTTKAKPRTGAKEDSEKPTSLHKEGMKQVKELGGRDTTKKGKGKAQPNGKFKSSEIIEDSDEELENPGIAIEDGTKSRKGLNAKAKSSTLSRSSTSSTATASSKPPMSSVKETPKVAGSLVPHSALKRPLSENVTNKASPRPRTDSSPQKRSPLASSPPTNAADLDNSQPSKPNSLASATSSPVFSSPRDRAQKAPVPSKISEPKHPSTALKRKAEDQASLAAPKRQQVNGNGNHIARPITNGICKSRPEHCGTTTTASSSQRSRTPSSSSASTSTSTASNSSAAAAAAGSTGIAKSSTTRPSDLQLQSARRFKIQFAKYQALHAKLGAVPVGERNLEDVRVVKRMHERIGELKREIWEGEREREREREREGGRGRNGKV